MRKSRGGRAAGRRRRRPPPKPAPSLRSRVRRGAAATASSVVPGRRLPRDELAASELFAAVDLGSNSFHGGQRVQGQIHLVDRIRRGACVSPAAGSTPARARRCVVAHARAPECLQRFGQRLRGIAPSACARSAPTRSVKHATSGCARRPSARSARDRRHPRTREARRLVYPRRRARPRRTTSDAARSSTSAAAARSAHRRALRSADRGEQP